MIKKALFEDELIVGMQRELQAHDKKQGIENLVKAADYLHSAMDILEEAGLSARAEEILQILSKIAQADEQDARPGKPATPKNPLKVHDPHTSGLTPKKMVKNIMEHGHPLNLSDDGKADDLLNADVGGEEKELEVAEQDLMPEMDFEDEV